MIGKEVLERLYVKEGRSLQGIATMLNCSLHRVQYWMRQHGLKARSRHEAGYLKWNPNGDPFKLKKSYSDSDRILLGLGLGLWWGEGYKRHQGAVRLGNSDPELVKVFVRFLENICGVRSEKIRFGLQIFSDIDPVEAKKFWMKSLGVSASRFLPKVTVTPSRGFGTYRQKIKHGVLTVYCVNVRLRKVMDDLMRKYALS